MSSKELFIYAYKEISKITLKERSVFGVVVMARRSDSDTGADNITLASLVTPTSDCGDMKLETR